MTTLILSLYLTACFTILTGMFGLLLINLSNFPRLQRFRPQEPDAGEQPLISILVPARDEAENIALCVRSLLAQKYERLEVLVLDDHSSDGTDEIVRSIIDELPASQFGRLRLLHGKALPPGWIGKNFACHQLSRQARGNYLFFTDADTWHAPDMASAVVACMQHYHVPFLTALPDQELRSFGEQLVVPLLNFTIFTLLPIPLVRIRPEPSLSMGNGQLLCFEKSAYTAIGGHEAVRDQILEDVRLARAIKASGRKMVLVDALELVRCRMYRSMRDVWAGFSKNLYAFYNHKLPFAALAIICNLALFVGPLLLFLLGPLAKVPLNITLAGGIAYLLAVLMRLVIALRFPRVARPAAWQQLLLCLLHPLAITLECLILLNSIRWRYRRAGTTWKGRQYP